MADQSGARTDGTDGREKRSRDRYGRERGPRGDRGGNDQSDDRQQAQRPTRDPQQALEGFAAPAAQPDVRPQAEPQMARAALASAPAPFTGATQQGLPKVQAFVLPIDELAQVAGNSGLSWVNSDADKINAAQAAMAAQPKAIHVPRERPASVAIDQGPLVLVETKRDLRDLRLPFEETVS